MRSRHSQPFRALPAVLAAIALATTLAGCGKYGPPIPPSPEAERAAQADDDEEKKR